jgi:fermentation-respiration switch protein FrsA (DUF1100 family)
MAAALALVAILAALFAIIWTQQRKLIYFPFRQVPAPEAVGLAGAVTVSFPTHDGLALNGWFVRPSASPWFSVIVFNGNGGNRAFRAPLARDLARHGIAVFLFDYRGYGGNPGVPSESGLARDSRAARRYVVERSDVDPARVVYLGESLGSAVATDLAAEFPPAGLILRSPFASMADVGRFHYPFLPVGLLLRDRFDTVDRISRVRSPLLVIAGDADRIVPLSHSRRLYDAANDPKQFVIIPGADHNDDALLSGRRMIDTIVEFLGNLARR